MSDKKTNRVILQMISKRSHLPNDFKKLTLKYS